MNFELQTDDRSAPLGILCQSPVSEGMSPREAVTNTLDLAEAAEQSGVYRRFWVAEHHSDRALASASPEILVATIAARTERLRVGSAGVLLPYYRPFKVAEQFNLLEALHPGRIDLGVGRSGGAEQQAPDALGLRPERMAPAGASAAFDELLAWLGEAGPEDRPRPGTFASPRGASAPQPWVLGTSPVSARYAGSRGLPYAFGGFLDPRGLVAALTAYHQAFQPSRFLDRPYVNLAWYVQAADSESEAQELTRSSEHWFVETLLRGGNPLFPAPESVAGAAYSVMEQMAIAMRRQYALVGTGEQVVAGLRELQATYRVDELTLVTIPFGHAERMRSYELIAEAWRPRG